MIRKNDKGAWRELTAASYLMHLGYHVFRAMSYAAICDLVAVSEDGDVLRVEVKGPHSTLPTVIQKKYDMLLMVSDDGAVSHM